MMENKILYWILDSAPNPDLNEISKWSENASGLIPVFCFNSKWVKKDRNLSAIIENVSQLRSRLIECGSNLLITCGDAEHVIPSLARVLKVKKVVGMVPDSFQFANDSVHIIYTIETVKKTLESHSIAFYYHYKITPETVLFSTPSLPPFPDIYPGDLPMLG